MAIIQNQTVTLSTWLTSYYSAWSEAAAAADVAVAAAASQPINPWKEIISTMQQETYNNSLSFPFNSPLLELTTFDSIRRKEERKKEACLCVCAVISL